MATKKAVKKFVGAARANDQTTLMAMLGGDPTLLDTPAHAPPKKDEGQTALQVALKCGSTDAALLLIERGANVNHMEASTVSNAWRCPLLHDAIRGALFAKDGAAAMKSLEAVLAAGADATARDSYGNGSLDRAMLDCKQQLHVLERWPRFPAVLSALIAHGADPLAASDTRPSPDAGNRGLQAYRFLVEAMGPLEGGRTPLHLAALRGDEQEARAQIEAGASLEALDDQGWSPLALAWWSLPMSKLLLEAGADPNASSAGSTPFVRSFHRHELAELMLAHGADPAATNAAGATYKPRV